MEKRTKILFYSILILIVLFPLLHFVVDFGGGTDDAASEMVVALGGEELELLPSIGYEPSETMEPILFALQMLIGVSLFAAAIYYWNKHLKTSPKEKQ